MAPVVFAELCALIEARVEAGSDVDFSSTTAHDVANSWHTTQDNQHFSAEATRLQRLL